MSKYLCSSLSDFPESLVTVNCCVYFFILASESAHLLQGYSLQLIIIDAVHQRQLVWTLSVKVMDISFKPKTQHDAMCNSKFDKTPLKNQY